jgi:hypothetical protein
MEADSRSLSRITEDLNISKVHGASTQGLHYCLFGCEPSSKRLGSTFTVLNLALCVHAAEKSIPMPLHDALDSIDLDEVEANFDSSEHGRIIDAFCGTRRPGTRPSYMTSSLSHNAGCDP